jgi:signal peptidase
LKRSGKLARIVLRWLLPLMALGVIVSGILFVTGVFAYKIYIIHTGSMSPTIPTRSAVIVHEGPAQVGQVVTFHAEGGVVTHRLVKQLPDGTYETKGDANGTIDPGTIGASQIIGPVVAAPHEVGYWLTYFKSWVGLGSLAFGILCLWLICSLLTEFGAARAAHRSSWVRWPKKRIGIILVVTGLTIGAFAGTAQASFEVRVSGTMQGTLDPSFATSGTTTTTVLEPATDPGTSSSTTTEPTTSSSETSSTEPTEPTVTEPSTTVTDPLTTEPTTTKAARPTTTTGPTTTTTAEPDTTGRGITTT